MLAQADRQTTKFNSPTKFSVYTVCTYIIPSILHAVPEQYFFLVNIDPEGIHRSDHCVYTNVKLSANRVCAMVVG